MEIAERIKQSTPAPHRGSGNSHDKTTLKDHCLRCPGTATAPN
jgi:hypothetical protein